jgi:hypothetical protein
LDECEPFGREGAMSEIKGPGITPKADQAAQPAREEAASNVASAPFGSLLTYRKVLRRKAARASAAEPSESSEGTIWRKATVELRDPTAIASPDASFAAATSGTGGEIPHRAKMEQSFGLDFGGVRAFVGREEALAPIGAEAATRKEQVAFASASPGPEVVAHELAHVAQGRAHGSLGTVHAKDSVSSPSHAAEVEADQVAARVVRGERVSVSAAPRTSISLKGTLTVKATATTKEGQTVEVEQDAQALAAMPASAIVDAQILPAKGLGGRTPVKVRRDALNLDTYTEVGAATGFAQMASAIGHDKVRPVATAQPNAGGAQQAQVAAPVAPADKAKDEEGGAPNSCFVSQRATRVDGNDIVIETTLRTKNRWDRVSWEVKLGPGKKGTELVIPPPRAGWNNPAWNASVGTTYTAQVGGAVGAADGDGQIAPTRTIKLKIPKATFNAHFGDGAPETSPVFVGMRLWYLTERGPTTATEAESSAAYGAPGLMHSWGYLRGDPDGSRVDLSAVKAALGLTKGTYLRDEQIWAQKLTPNPSPNKERAFPPELAKKLPKGGTGKEVKLQTRIENEATLKVLSAKGLADIIGKLEGYQKDDAAFNSAMQKAGGLLTQFTWKLKGEGGGVFTDLYMDDPGMHALAADIGIRKRMTPKAVKLNVKTGEGYRVPGKGDQAPPSDIYRRHEIGFDLNPAAKGADIGKYLASGLNQKGENIDPWNKGGEQANLVAKANPEGDGQAIDFAKMQPKMLLKGNRKKFTVQATKIGGNGSPINIEISCDHTAGREFDVRKDSEIQIATDATDKSKEEQQKVPVTDATYKHIFNVEMELEHLGVGGPPASGDAGPATKDKDAAPQEPVVVAASSGASGGLAQALSLQPGDQPAPPEATPRPEAPVQDAGAAAMAVPKGHPGRVYMNADASDPAFNTPSFDVFYHAEQQLVALLKSDDAPLSPDVQKLVALRDKIFADE